MTNKTNHLLIYSSDTQVNLDRVLWKSLSSLDQRKGGNVMIQTIMLVLIQKQITAHYNFKLFFIS